MSRIEDRCLFLQCPNQGNDNSGGVGSLPGESLNASPVDDGERSMVVVKKEEGWYGKNENDVLGFRELSPAVPQIKSRFLHIDSATV